MKHLILVLATMPVVNGVVHRLPGVNVPIVTIKPTMLPNVKLPIISPNQTLKLAATPVPAVNIALPGVFNPNSPISFPTAQQDPSGNKVTAKLAALFDGAGDKVVPAVPVDGSKTQEMPVQQDELPLIKAAKSDSHVTLPENDLLTEIGL
jgi:hypothetical protein